MIVFRIKFFIGHFNFKHQLVHLLTYFLSFVSIVLEHVSLTGPCSKQTVGESVCFHLEDIFNHPTVNRVLPTWKGVNQAARTPV